jgi:hypothetical protein
LWRRNAQGRALRARPPTEQADRGGGQRGEGELQEVLAPDGRSAYGRIRAKIFVHTPPPESADICEAFDRTGSAPHLAGPPHIKAEDRTWRERGGEHGWDKKALASATPAPQAERLIKRLVHRGQETTGAGGRKP